MLFKLQSRLFSGQENSYAHNSLLQSFSAVHCGAMGSQLLAHYISTTSAAVPLSGLRLGGNGPTRCRRLDARQTQCRRLDADTTIKQQFGSLTIYFGIELAWHRVGGIESAASSRRHRSVPDPVWAETSFESTT